MPLSLVQAATPTLNTQSISFASNITPGNSVILCMSRNNGFTTPVTISGNGNTLTQAELSANSFCGIWFYSNVGASPGNTITAASGAAVLYAYEVSGPITQDQVARSSTFGGSTGTTWTVSSATTTVASEFWVGVVYGISGPSSIAGPGGAWTNEATEANAAVSGYEVASSTGVATYSGTFGSASTYEACVATFSAPPPSFSGSPSTGITLGGSATGASRRNGSPSTGITITTSYGRVSTGVTIGGSVTGHKSVTATGGGYSDIYSDIYGSNAGISAAITITPSAIGSVGVKTGVTITPSCTGSVVPFSGSPTTGITITPSATGTAPGIGAPSTGIVLTAVAHGVKRGSGAPSTGVTIGGSVTGHKSMAGSTTTGMVFGSSAAGQQGAGSSLRMSVAPTGGTDQFGNTFVAGLAVYKSPAGYFVYNGPPILGNLVYSTAPSGFTDQAGNVVPAGTRTGPAGAAVTADLAGNLTVDGNLTVNGTISGMSGQIASLQAQINSLSAQVATVSNAENSDAQNIGALQSQVNQLNQGIFTQVPTTTGAAVFTVNMTAANAGSGQYTLHVGALANFNSGPNTTFLANLAGGSGVPLVSPGGVATDPNSGGTWAAGERANYINDLRNKWNALLGTLIQQGYMS